VIRAGSSTRGGGYASFAVGTARITGQSNPGRSNDEDHAVGPTLVREVIGRIVAVLQVVDAGRIDRSVPRLCIINQ
jgi:hypothetical protein